MMGYIGTIAAVAMTARIAACWVLLHADARERTTEPPALSSGINSLSPRMHAYPCLHTSRPRAWGGSTLWNLL